MSKLAFCKRDAVYKVIELYARCCGADPLLHCAGLQFLLSGASATLLVMMQPDAQTVSAAAVYALPGRFDSRRWSRTLP